MDLEAKVQHLEESSKIVGIVSRRDTIGLRKSELPRAPPKYSLTGHRSPITVS